MKSRFYFLMATSLLAVTGHAIQAPTTAPALGPAAEYSLLSIQDPTPPPLEPAPPVCAPVPAGAVAWWRAESNTVDTVGINDVVPFENRLKTLLYMPGKVGFAFRFFSNWGPFGATNYMLVPPSSDLDVGAGAGLTMEGWVNPGSLAGFQPLCEWNDGKGGLGAGLALNGSALEASFGDTNNAPLRRIILRSATGLFATSVWHHVALTFDQASGQAAAYVDGLSVAQTNLGAFRPATQTRFYLGFRPSGTNAGRFYTGGVDELTIYNRALAVGELGSIVAADSGGKCVPPARPPVPPPADFTGWWRGESNALDSVDSNNAINAGGVDYVAGVVGKAFEFSTGYFDTGYLRIPAASNLNLGLGPGLTIEAWISPEPLSVLNPPKTGREFVGWHSVVITQGLSLSLSSIPRSPVFPPFPSPASAWQANVPDTQGHSHIFYSPADLAPLGVWQHVALTYDKASGLAVLYFNGNPVTQTNLGSFTPQTAADLDLGYQAGSPFPTRVPSGDLDEVSLYARALSAAEIRAIMLARGAGKARVPPAILTQPANLRANAGGTAMFTVAATGNPILKYQWRKTGIGLPGATRSSLVLSNLQPAQAGIYSVRITNAFGAVFSSNALLTVNLLPVADASATQPQVIAPLHCDATAVLDGSKSYDPDGDPLNFAWFKAGSAVPLATGMVAVVTLPVGTNALVLVVDDGLATNSQSFTVEVITMSDVIQHVITLVDSQVPRPQPLLATLSAALAAINRLDPTPAINELQAFQNKVLAQVAPENPVLAQTLIRSSQQLVAILVVDCSPARPAARIATVSRQPNGKLRVHFSAPEGFIYILEASTNLVDWEKIGVATDSASGEFDFEDAAAPQTPARFYRLAVP